MRYLLLCLFVLSFSLGCEVQANQDLFDEARFLYNQGKFTEAVSLYKEIIKSDASNIGAYLNLACLYKDLADYKRAIEILKEALNFSKDARLKILLGRLYYLSGIPGEGVVCLKQLLSSAPENAILLLYLGLCYEDLGKLAEAEDCYLKTIKIQPHNTLAYLKLGDIYYQKQLFHEAAEILQDVVSLDPSITHIRQRIAESLEKSGNFEEAYRQYAKCLAIYAEDKFLQEKLVRVKSRLGEDFFRKKEEITSKRRRRRLIRVNPSPFAQVAPLVKVGIADIIGLIEFKCGSDFRIIDKQSGKSLFEGRKESIYSLVFEQRSIQLRNISGNILLKDLDKPFLIQNKSNNSVISLFDIPIGTGNFWAGWQDRRYRGTIEIIPKEEGFQLINLINLEEYLYGVLPAEMPADWPKQALRTQAIAARTWAVKNLTRHTHQGFNFCDSVHCQVYKGAGVETRRTNQVVDDTAGIVLMSGEVPIEIFYSANCGGCTREGIVDAISLDFRFPLSPLELEDWLLGYPDTFCNQSQERATNFRWVRMYGQKDLEKIFDKFNIEVGKILRIIPRRRAESGHLVRIKIEGEKGTKIIKGENNIRKILGNLRSSAFKTEVKYNQYSQPEEFIFYGGGFGHARGLCQAGVKGMALRGYNYLEILKHYYPDAEIKKIY